MIDDRHAEVSSFYFKRGDFQSPNWVCCPFSSSFARLVQITSSHVGEELFLVHEKGLNTTPFSLIAAAGFLPVTRVTTSLFSALTTSGSLLTHAADRWPVGRSISRGYWLPNKGSLSLTTARPQKTWTSGQLASSRLIFWLATPA